MLELLEDVQRLMFKHFTYITDMDNHGLRELWTPPDEKLTHAYHIAVKTEVWHKQDLLFKGDCEDYAMLARSIVQKLLPDEDVRLVVCRDETGALHCVMSVGGWIIDNRYKDVNSNVWLRDNGYKFIAISGVNLGDDWKLLEESKSE